MFFKKKPVLPAQDHTCQPGSKGRVLVVLNQAARSGSAPAGYILEYLRLTGFTGEMCWVRKGEHPKEAVERHPLDGVDGFLIGGGDGTLNAMIPVLRSTQKPFGILPLGTANDLARSLGIPLTLEGALESFVKGVCLPLDVGLINNRHAFFNVASIGMSAVLAQELSSEVKSRLGVFGYVMTACKILRRARPFTAWMTMDGKTKQVKTLQISIGNGRHHGGGMTVDEEATPMDGVFHVYSLNISHWSQVFKLLPGLRRGTQKSYKDIETHTVRYLTLQTKRPRWINTDGELCIKTPAHFCVVPKAVMVRVHIKMPLKETDPGSLA